MDFAKLYTFEGDLSASCMTCHDVCEIWSPAVFLPGEAEYVARMRGVSLQELIQWRENGLEMISHPDKPCIYFKDGRCANREFRPLDCRIYPLMLGLEGDEHFGEVVGRDADVVFILSKHCKAAQNNEVTERFIQRAIAYCREALQMVRETYGEDVARQWVRAYSKMPPHVLPASPGLSLP